MAAPRLPWLESDVPARVRSRLRYDETAADFLAGSRRLRYSPTTALDAPSRSKPEE